MSHWNLQRLLFREARDGDTFLTNEAPRYQAVAEVQRVHALAGLHAHGWIICDICDVLLEVVR